MEGSPGEQSMVTRMGITTVRRHALTRRQGVVEIGGRHFQSRGKFDTQVSPSLLRW